MTPARRLGALLLAGAALAGTAAPARAQGYPFSQRGSVSQHVAHTTVAIEYGRPVARGRVLFGQLVPWDSVWHPGADSATRITFDHPLRLEGQEVEAGEYSVWLIPRASQPWTVILSRAAHVFHKPYPGAARDAYRFDVTPETRRPHGVARLLLPVGGARSGGAAHPLGRDDRADPGLGTVPARRLTRRGASMSVAVVARPRRLYAACGLIRRVLVLTPPFGGPHVSCRRVPGPCRARRRGVADVVHRGGRPGPVRRDRPVGGLRSASGSRAVRSTRSR